MFAQLLKYAAAVEFAKEAGAARGLATGKYPSLFRKAVDIARGAVPRPASHVRDSITFLKETSNITPRLIQATADVANGVRPRPASIVNLAKKWLIENNLEHLIN